METNAQNIFTPPPPKLAADHHSQVGQSRSSKAFQVLEERFQRFQGRAGPDGGCSIGRGPHVSVSFAEVGGGSDRNVLYILSLLRPHQSEARIPRERILPVSTPTSPSQLISPLRGAFRLESGVRGVGAGWALAAAGWVGGGRAISFHLLGVLRGRDWFSSCKTLLPAGDRALTLSRSLYFRGMRARGITGELEALQTLIFVLSFVSYFNCLCFLI